jgi:triacylglycerol lipase
MSIRLLLSFSLLAACTSDEAIEYDKQQAAAEAEQRPEDGKVDGLDVCGIAGWYGDGICDRFCARFDEDCPQLGPDPGGPATRHPIVLHHGMAGGRSWILTYAGIREALAADGHAVVQTQVPPFDSVEVRAGALAAAIDQALAATGATKVNLIAHAMGGLDARYLISRLGYGDRVASLTTMSTPHRGAALADVALELAPNDLILNAIALVVGASVSDVGGDPHLRAALQAMAEETAGSFNAATPDDPRVFYQSWSGVSSLFGSASDRTRALAACEGKMSYIPAGTFDKLRIEFAPFTGIVGHGGADPHDGMVTVASAKWGQFQGCVPGDHSDEIGRMTSSRPNPRTGFDPQRFWRQVAFDLAARGF